MNYNNHINLDRYPRSRSKQKRNPRNWIPEQAQIPNLNGQEKIHQFFYSSNFNNDYYENANFGNHPHYFMNQMVDGPSYSNHFPVVQPENPLMSVVNRDDVIQGQFGGTRITDEYLIDNERQLYEEKMMRIQMKKKNKQNIRLQQQQQQQMPKPATKQLLEGLAQPVECSKAERMMKMMGWQGGALGTKGDGITEPVIPNLNHQTKAGLGHQSSPPPTPKPLIPIKLNLPKKQFKKPKYNRMYKTEIFKYNILHLILAFVKDVSKSELVFDSKFSNQERKFIHNLIGNLAGELIDYDSMQEMELLQEIILANNYLLTTESEGKHPNRKLHLYKEAPEHVYLITKQDLEPVKPEIIVVEPPKPKKKDSEKILINKANKQKQIADKKLQAQKRRENDEECIKRVCLGMYKKGICVVKENPDVKTRNLGKSVNTEIASVATECNSSVILEKIAQLTTDSECNTRDKSIVDSTLKVNNDSSISNIANEETIPMYAEIVDSNLQETSDLINGDKTISAESICKASDINIENTSDKSKNEVSDKNVQKAFDIIEIEDESTCPDSDCKEDTKITSEVTVDSKIVENVCEIKEIQAYDNLTNESKNKSGSNGEVKTISDKSIITEIAPSCNEVSETELKIDHISKDVTTRQDDTNVTKISKESLDSKIPESLQVIKDIEISDNTTKDSKNEKSLNCDIKLDSAKSNLTEIALSTKEIVDTHPKIDTSKKITTDVVTETIEDPIEYFQKKLDEYYKEFLECSEYTELRFLGDFYFEEQNIVCEFFKEITNNESAVIIGTDCNGGPVVYKSTTPSNEEADDNQMFSNYDNYTNDDCFE